PGYLFEEMAKISHESAGSSHCLLEYLLNRLQSNSCNVKLKVLKILLHMCSHGSSYFLLQLKRNASFIQEATVFAGPPDPLHGNSLYQKVRVTAQDLASALFSDVLLPQPVAIPPKELPSTGMGSRPSPHGSLQGFGFERSGSVTHQPGLAGGGWEELDSGQSSQNSLQENSELSRTSDSYSKSGSDNHSGALEPGSIAERTDAENLGDCLQEVSLVSKLTRGSKVFLTREETQHFIKECGLLNCEVVLAILNRTLKDPSECVCMRAMCAIYSLMCSDLLSHDQILAITQQHLQELSQESPGPVANKATKILRQFEALSRSHPTSKTSSPVPGHCAPARATPKRPDDLLADTMPFAEEAILKPLSLVPQPSQVPEVLTRAVHPSEGQMLEPGSSGQLGISQPPELGQRGPECRLPNPEPQEDRPPRGDPDGTVSLFAGMELVAPSSMILADALEQECIPPAPWTAPCTGSTRATEDNQGPSAFSFLNA
uniref:TEPSIN adaptor related protein complex 4 accessory protein n=1 Tax=Podarcis muralis TaxID=64176 RepID=A0A670HU10_PODMU